MIEKKEKRDHASELTGKPLLCTCYLVGPKSMIYSSHPMLFVMDRNANNELTLSRPV